MDSLSPPETIPPLTLQTSAQTARAYAALTCDENPIHLDADFAARTAFGVPIAHGTMSLNLLLQAISATPGLSIGAGRLDLRFSAPVKVGQTITASGTRCGDGSYAVSVSTPEGQATLKGVFYPGNAP
ncbi:MaoC family dehydratase [Falsigemmobacter faecalis]|uniref:Acyl dehydratase n=1 Tax=Falsigemmobacter faecalis TaxID=2488730 RepID=A0A3P3DPN3_9RHOB|nr:MaoC family dehydratase [Falsigemmobacter faecalis]RRH76190.1 acyl dehydratase [Falsigemmobacter faecalis]